MARPDFSRTTVWEGQRGYLPGSLAVLRSRLQDEVAFGKSRVGCGPWEGHGAGLCSFAVH